MVDGDVVVDGAPVVLVVTGEMEVVVTVPTVVVVDDSVTDDPHDDTTRANAPTRATTLAVIPFPFCCHLIVDCESRRV